MRDDVVRSGPQSRIASGAGDEMHAVGVAAGVGPCGDVTGAHEHRAAGPGRPRPRAPLRRSPRQGASCGWARRRRPDASTGRPGRCVCVGPVSFSQAPGQVVDDVGAAGPGGAGVIRPHPDAGAHEPPSGAFVRLRAGLVEASPCGCEAAAPVKQTVPVPELRRPLQLAQGDDGGQDRPTPPAGGCRRAARDGGGCGENGLQHLFESMRRPRRLLIDEAEGTHELVVPVAAGTGFSESRGARCDDRSASRTSESSGGPGCCDGSSW